MILLTAKDVLMLIYDALYLRYGSCLEDKIQGLCPSAIYKQNVSISLRSTEHIIRKLKISSYVLLACINPFYKNGQAFMFF